MTRSRSLLGVLTGAILVASSAAHSLMGWPQLRGALRAAGTPADLITGLSIGWHFAGVAILTFGCLALWLFTDALRGRQVSLRPLVAIGHVYAAFGVWALAGSNMNPFVLVFVVPGLMLVAAAWQPRDAVPRAAARERAAA